MLEVLLDRARRDPQDRGPNDVYLGGRTSGTFPGFMYAGGTDAFVSKIARGE